MKFVIYENNATTTTTPTPSATKKNAQKHTLEWTNSIPPRNFHVNGHSITPGIASTDSKVRTTLYSTINSTTGKYYSVAFI